MLAFSEAGRETILKVGVYGASGEGKTYLGCTAPDPVILLFEKQGFATIRLWAKQNRRPIPPTLLLRNQEEFDVVMRALAKDKERPIARAYVELNKLREGDPTLWLDEATMKQAIGSLPYQIPKWCVVDSATELAYAIERGIHAEAPPQLGKDGLPAPSMRHSNTLADRFTLAVKRIRDLDMNVLVLALRDDREKGEGEEKTMETTPDLPMRKMPRVLISTLNALGLLRRERVEVQKEGAEDGESELVVKRVVRFAPLPSYVRGKPYGDLGVEEPDVSTWIQKLEAASAVEEDTSQEPQQNPKKTTKKER